MNWDEYFKNLLPVIASKSKDLSTQVGAIIVGPDHEIRSTGYNSFPRGLNDDLPERQERPLKYFYFEHGERNAIYNAARVGTSTKGCILYVTGTPCSDCARGIIQAGIKEVVIYDTTSDGFKERFKESMEQTCKMLEECGIVVREI